jgi:hypothetical protein
VQSRHFEITPIYSSAQMITGKYLSLRRCIGAFLLIGPVLWLPVSLLFDEPRPGLVLWKVPLELLVAAALGTLSWWIAVCVLPLFWLITWIPAVGAATLHWVAWRGLLRWRYFADGNRFVQMAASAALAAMSLALCVTCGSAVNEQVFGHAIGLPASHTDNFGLGMEQVFGKSTSYNLVPPAIVVGMLIGLWLGRRPRATLKSHLVA